MNTFINSEQFNKNKVIFIMGPTVTEKSRKIESDSDFTAEDFCLQDVAFIENILKTQHVPIIFGGSNAYIENLLKSVLFIWIDVEQSVLKRRVDMRVDQMVKAGLVNEV
uniref:Uncharacterized protein n=1 Tax=Solanum lycopersicum TaxID=4081 RepID=A0A3Q7IVR3_SOLLC